MGTLAFPESSLLVGTGVAGQFFQGDHTWTHPHFAADAARIARLAGSRIKSVLDAGRALRSAVLDATTEEQIEAVVDDRT